MPKSNSLIDLDAYKYYANLTSRPEGTPLWEVNENGIPNNKPGEVFCRYPIKTADGIKMCDYQKVSEKTLVRHIKDTHCEGKNFQTKNRGRKAKGEVERLEEFYDSLTGRRAEEVYEETQTEKVPHATQSEMADEALAKVFQEGYQRAKDEDAAELADMKEELGNATSYKAEFFEKKEFMEERRKEVDTREAKLNEREQTLLAREAVEQAKAR